MLSEINAHPCQVIMVKAAKEWDRRIQDCTQIISLPNGGVSIQSDGLREIEDGETREDGFTRYVSLPVRTSITISFYTDDGGTTAYKHQLEPGKYTINVLFEDEMSYSIIKEDPTMKGDIKPLTDDVSELELLEKMQAMSEEITEKMDDMVSAARELDESAQSIILDEAIRVSRFNLFLMRNVVHLQQEILGYINNE